MRYLLLSSALLLAGIVTVASAQMPPVPSGVVMGAAGAPRPTTVKRTVYLNHVVLEELKKSNLERYARVRAVMGAASELCGANAGRQWAVANGQSTSCSGMTLKMSFPAKREIGFLVDDTWYIALVTVRDKPALRAAEPGKLIPLDNTK
jgi:hypothetical protein